MTPCASGVEPEVRMLAVVAAHPCRQAGADEQRVPEPPLERCAPLDRLDDRGVEADARVEAEEAAVDPTETDRSQIGCVEPVGEQIRRGDRIVGHAEGSGEHVRRTAGQDAERRVGAGDTGRHFVEGAVAAVSDHDVDTAPGGIVGEAGGVTAPIVSTTSTSWPRASRRCTTTVLRAR